MTKFLIGSALALALSSTALTAAPTGANSHSAPSAAQPEQLWLAQGKGNGKGGPKLIKKGKGKGEKAKATKPKGKPEHAGGPKDKATPAAQAGEGKAKEKGKMAAVERKAYSQAERDDLTSRITATPAPEGRDMARILGTSGLLLATPQLVVSETPEDELITYRNCPPGLAKKDPPCVPPGLAKKGVTYEDWAAYDADRYDDIWIERRDDWLAADRDIEPDPELLLLRSDQVATLYGLDPAPEGQRYALIDGLPVLLDDEDYRSLLLVNQIAEVTDLTEGLTIAPTAALTQQDLISLYRLPELGEDENYAVVNGQLLRLNDNEYEMLQMIRIARAVL